ncbi:TPA: hypothetical protein HA361_00110 [Candidatus Woesearchaeota archaeon]|nr:hypothetical protein [Candidatus Woesearchaeota archaeon]HII69047.1 hypothetical protein [Candidatus Woesearchaeota archaeon]
MAVFELIIISFSAIFLLLLYKIDKLILKKYVITFIGVLIFEYFTQALWTNQHLEPWAYLYLDVSWVMTLAWTTLIAVSRAVVEAYLPQLQECGRFLLSLVIIAFIGILIEATVLHLGFRAYSSAVIESLSGLTMFTIAPIELLYYIPVFSALVLAFSRYWEINLFGTALSPASASEDAKPSRSKAKGRKK